MLPEIIVQWKVALIPLKNHCIGNGYLKLGQGKITKDNKFIMNLVNRLSLKTKNAFLIDKLKTKILLVDWTSHKCVSINKSNPGQALKLKFILKKKQENFPMFFLP